MNNTENMPKTPLIDIEHISKVYQMGEETVHALRDVSLQIFPNDYLQLWTNLPAGWKLREKLP